MPNDPLSTVQSIVLVLVPMILSLSVHEYAHAFVAYRLGDDTASRMGRMTLSPLSHIDVMGTLVIPAMAVVFGAPFIGWAKPVPVNPARFRRDVNMGTGMAITAAAGPISNILLAVLAAALIRLLFQGADFFGAGARLAGLARPTLQLLVAMLQLNVALAIFNLLPIPPLDGSRLLPRRWQAEVERLGQYSFLLMLAIIATPLRVILIVPMRVCVDLLVTVFGIA